MNNELKQLIKKEGKTAWLYMAVETTNDPDYEDTTEVLLIPVPVKCIITSITPEKIQWKFQGVNKTEAKDLIMHKRFLKTVRLTHKIVIDSADYYGYRDNYTGFSVQELDDSYIRVSTMRIK